MRIDEIMERAEALSKDEKVDLVDRLIVSIHAGAMSRLRRAYAEEAAEQRDEPLECAEQP